MAKDAQREVLLTLSVTQHAELAEDVAGLRRRLGTSSVTQTILAGLREANRAGSRPLGPSRRSRKNAADSLDPAR
jgi:hypothetical protein